MNDRHHIQTNMLYKPAHHPPEDSGLKLGLPLDGNPAIMVWWDGRDWKNQANQPVEIALWIERPRLQMRVTP